MKDVTLVVGAAALMLLFAWAEGDLAKYPWLALLILGSAYFYWFQGDKE